MAEKNQGRKAKGTLLVPLAIIVNGRKDLDWKGDGGLTDQDLQLIRAGILASAWYDLNLFEKIGRATFRMVGKNRPEVADQFGQGMLWGVLVNIYRSALLKDDPGEALAKLASVYQGTFFSTGSAEFAPTEQGGTFKITDPEGIPAQEVLALAFKSLIGKTVRENQGKNVRVECEEESLLNSRKLDSLSYQIYWAKK